ncbi:VOC family protein [Micromonospora trifolii]|uniref:VOC family protein n=1 Tax=Micromonospora trifolii TaxID=2911208 RepID=UPI003CF8F299
MVAGLRHRQAGQEPAAPRPGRGHGPQAEVRRLLSLGARQLDVGQTGAEQFTVLADPEGNEFCVLDHAPTR